VGGLDDRREAAHGLVRLLLLGDVTLHGDLTLHGVTKSVDIPAKAQLNGSQIQVLGSLAFPFSDFSINAPNIGGFVAVEDHGTLEFLVNLTKA
jgi:polyisoprenoid-binding protein YceI